MDPRSELLTPAVDPRWASVCGAYFTGDVEPAARSFSAWLGAWCRAAVLPDLMGEDDMVDEVGEGCVFEGEASFVRWWNGNAGWAREVAPD
ncbi:MAG: hypothetical protein RID81_17120 [Sandaracinaceae bacterium]